MDWRRHLRALAPVIALVEPATLLLCAPLLLFPTVRPQWTMAGLAVMAGLALARWIVRGELWPATPFNVALLLFVLTLPVAWWASAWPELSWPKLAGIILGLLTFRLLALSVCDRRTLSWGLAVFLATGAGILALGALSTGWPAKIPLLRPLVQQLPRQLTELPGTEGQGINANQLAGATLFYLPVMAALAVGWWRKKRPWLALIALGGAGIVAALLLLTQSRSAWIGGIGSILALIVLTGLASRTRWVRIAAVVLPVVTLLALAGLLVALGPEQIAALWPGESGLSAEDVVGRISLSGRVEIWSRALYAIQDFPFTGTGLGTFRRVVHLLYPLFTISPDVDIAHAHNMFLQVALDVGLPGLIAYLALLWIAGAAAWQVVRQGTPWLRALAIGLLTGLIGLHLYGLTDALALGSKPSIAFWLILGLLAALANLTETNFQNTTAHMKEMAPLTHSLHRE